MITIAPARPTHADKLSQLALRSKAHWGYDEEFMRACKGELSYSEDDLKNPESLYFIAKEDNQIIGFYKLAEITERHVILEALFIEPSFIGKGVGRTLLKHAKNQARKRGATSIIAHSDPQAEPFYTAMGGKVIGKIKSGSIAGRYLPVIEILLK